MCTSFSTALSTGTVENLSPEDVLRQGEANASQARRLGQIAKESSKAIGVATAMQHKPCAIERGHKHLTMRRIGDEKS